MNQASQQTGVWDNPMDYSGSRDASNDTDQVKKEPSTYVEPLPESSRPRRDGPGGN